MIKFIRYWLIKTVGVSKSEANAMMILIPAIVAFSIVPQVIISNFNSEYNYHAKDQQILDNLISQIENNKKSIKKSIKSNTKYNPSPFDPNTAPLALLQSNGIPTFLANRLINYRSKGGKFFQKKDIQKLYGFSDSLYALVSPYIFLKNIKKQVVTFNNKKQQPKKYQKWKIKKFNLNAADTSYYRQIKGIGSKLSTRIIKFRDRLGGFHSTSQLYEVWGIPSEVVEELLIYGSITNEHTVSQISINTDTIKSLSVHPYISYKIAKAIVVYRQQHGDYQQLDQLKNIYHINDSIYQKIKPYIKL